MKAMVDYGFAERLRHAQKNDSYSLVNDVIVTKQNNSYSVVIILNNGNLFDRKKFNTDLNVTLFVESQVYMNVLKPISETVIRMLEYRVDYLPPVGTLSLVDYSTGYLYNNLPYREVVVPPKRKKIAICAYISSYNSVAEIKHWLAYYSIQKVDNVILYCAEPIEKFIKELRKPIESGFLILYHYPWPITRSYGPHQFSIQVSQINSCYYRHRELYEYIISQDVDEYMYSEKYLFDLYHGIQDAFGLDPGFDSVKVQSFMYLGGSNREESLQNGTLFLDYTLRMDNRNSGRPKQVISTKSGGRYSVHICYMCKQFLLGKVDILRIAHFKARVQYKDRVEESRVMGIYAPKVKRLMQLM